MNVRASYRCVCLSLLLGSAAASAQIVTDGTVGPATRLSGPEMTVGAELGSTRGANLFHSFQRFDIQSGQTATFTGPDQIRNVIGRVTGGQTSNIDGTLHSTVGQADVYLINPSGIVMGPNARVDVPAALHLSTADELRFSDGSRYSASDPANSTLTLAAPESFGFLSPQPASLTIAGSQLELKPGKTATLTAGDVSISGTQERRVTLTAPGGEIRVEAVGTQRKEIAVATPSQQPGTGRLSMTRATLSTSSDGEGRIVVRAGDLDMDAARISSDVYRDSDRPGRTGRVQLELDGTLAMLSGSVISSDTYAGGDAGQVSIRAGTVQLDGRGSESLTGITADAQPRSGGQAGAVTLELAGRLELLDGALIRAATWGTGDAGTVRIQADSARLDGAGDNWLWTTGILTDTNQDASGRAGRVTLDLAGSLEILNGAVIWSNSFGPGDAGSIDIRARSATLDGRDSSVIWTTGISSSADLGATGRTGRVLLEVSDGLEIRNGAVIGNGAFPFGHTGSIELRAGHLQIDGADSDDTTGILSQATSNPHGQAGEIRVSVDGPLEILNGGLIATSTSAGKPAGTIRIQTETLRLDGGGQRFTGIASQSSQAATARAGDITLEIDSRLEVSNGALIASLTRGAGDAGAIAARAGSVRLDGQDGALVTGLVSSAEPGAGGRAGNTTLEVRDRLEILNGASIVSYTYGAGDAGVVDVRAGSARLDSGGIERFTGIASSAEGQTSSGRALEVGVTIDGQLEILNGAAIASRTDGQGDAGTVRIRAGSARLEGPAEDQRFRFTGVSSAAQPLSTGRSGDIDLMVEDRLQLSQMAEIASSTLGRGDAGSVQIQAGRLDIQSGAGIGSSTQSAGDAGSVSVRAAVLGIDGGGVDDFTGITTQSTQDATGQVGHILIDADHIALSNNGRISNEAKQTLDDSSALVAVGEDVPEVEIRAKVFELAGGLVTAASLGNVPASDIRIQADALSLANASRITTEAAQNRAGQIKISGGRLWLTDSLITTSALGETGNGGKITLTPEHLILDGGFIQANTAAPGARGGDILIDSRALIASESLVEIGGVERQTFATGSRRNIIQAAAPGGEQGTIDVTSPDLDITAALVPLATAFDDPDDLLTDLCRGVTGSAASSLIERGAGGLPPIPFAPASVSFKGERLDRVGTP
jgi:filamentous hemagglutinin family protein